MQQGSFNEASQVLNDILEADTDHAQAWYFLAVCQRKLKQYDAAKASLNRLLVSSPKHAHGYQELGHLLLETARIKDAISAFERATHFNPALHGAWRALAGQADYAQRQEAQRQLAWLESLPPELTSVASFIHQRKLHKAEALCRQFLKQQPHHPEAMRLLAQLGLKFHILDDAELLLKKCLEFEPQHLQARLDLVEVLHRRQKFPEALAQAQLLYDTDPNNPGFAISLANALQANGDYSAAAKHYQYAIDTSPGNASVYVALGNALKTAGHTDQAVLAYQNAYAAQSDFGDAYWSLANLKTYQFSEIELTEMQRQLKRPELEEIDRARLHFALGKAYEDLNEFNQSFQHYEQGNNIKAEENKFDLTRITTELDYQKTHFDNAFFAARKEYGNDAPDPIFIVGMPRAGSTLLEQILASHSQVDGTMELANIIAYAHRFNGRSVASDQPKYPAILNKLTAEQARKLGDMYLAETRAHRRGAAFFIDKMPNNFRHIALIKLMLPNAKIIDARRDPMACCFSGYKQLFAEGQEFSYSLTGIGHYYRAYVEVMQHWQQVLTGDVLLVRHEDVIGDLDTQVRRLLEFCGLEFEQACIDFHQSTRAVRTPSSEQVRQPIFKTSMQQWRHYEAYLQPLKTALDSGD